MEQKVVLTFDELAKLLNLYGTNEWSMDNLKNQYYELQKDILDKNPEFDEFYNEFVWYWD